MSASIQKLLIFLFLFHGFLTYSFSERGMDYSAYQNLLAKYVDDKGLVNYKGLKEDQAQFKSFLVDINAVTEEDYNQWNEADQTAYWINAYNAFTLQAIIDHYPIKAGWLSSLTYPKNSIRQIAGVWDELKFDAMGKQVTLDEIEHQILRVEFDEPRIHVAIVCASIGCPPLRNEAFTGEKLEEQLVDQSKRFLANPQNFRIGQDTNTVYLSSIFSWFGDDFINQYGETTNFQHLNQTEQAVIHFIFNSVSKSQQEYLENNKFTISYTDYNWTLNEQP
jgi:hypothetical protein